MSVVGPQFEECMFRPVPLVDHFFDQVLTFLEPKAKRSLVPFAAGIAMNFYPHPYIVVHFPSGRVIVLKQTPAIGITGEYISHIARGFSREPAIRHGSSSRWILVPESHVTGSLRTWLTALSGDHSVINKQLVDDLLDGSRKIWR